MGQYGTNRRVSHVPVKLYGLGGWTDSIQKYHTGLSLAQYLWACYIMVRSISQGQFTSEHWKLGGQLFPQIISRYYQLKVKYLSKGWIRQVWDRSRKIIEFHSQIMHHKLILCPLEKYDGLGSKNQLKVRWSKIWRSYYQSMYSLTFKFPYLFETR